VQKAKASLKPTNKRALMVVPSMGSLGSTIAIVCGNAGVHKFDAFSCSQSGERWSPTRCEEKKMDLRSFVMTAVVVLVRKIEAELWSPKKRGREPLGSCE
jgi:hypothetical protein